MTDLVKTYFEAFNNKDLNTLSELYADNVILDEWNENIFVGKDAVLNANKELFDKYTNVNIEILTSGIDDVSSSTLHISLNEIAVTLDDEVHIIVVDVIEILDDKIRRIIAYRGF